MMKTLSQPSPTEPPEEKKDSRALPRRTVKLSVRWFCYPAVSDTDLGIVSVRVVLGNTVFFNASSSGYCALRNLT